MTGKYVLILVGLVFGFNAEAAKSNYEGFVKLKDGRKLYVDYIPPQHNLPVVVMINGLTYDTENWSALTDYLARAGYGVFRYDAWGMGRTLLGNDIPTKAINYRNQVEDLNQLLSIMKVKGPYNLLGLSYGGGIACAFGEIYPNKVNNLILFAPYTEFLQAQKEWIKKQIDWTRAMYPWNKATDEELVDYFIRQFAYATYPIYEPSSLENPFKMEGIVAMVQGIRMYQPIEHAHTLPAQSVHLIVAGMDQYVERDILDRFWKQVGKGDGQASYMVMMMTEHKMPEFQPKFTAEWVNLILRGTPELFNGDKFEGYPMFSKIKREDGKEIPLPRRK